MKCGVYGKGEMNPKGVRCEYLVVLPAVCKEVRRPFARRVLQGSDSWIFNVLNVEYRLTIEDFRSEEARSETLAYQNIEN